MTNDASDQISADRAQPVRARIVLNPRAGNAEDIGGVRAALRLWQAAGWDAEIVTTAYAGHATVLAREAADQAFDLVVAAGGDGTVNEVINGLAQTQTALAVLPFGTMNVWVRELRLPLRPVDAASSLLNGRVIDLDLGMAGERYFLLMAGIGFDAAVTQAVLPEAKRKLGLFAYIVQAMLTARTIRGTRARIELDGRPVRGRVLMVVIGNSRLYGGYLQITHHANLTDGLLDVALIKGEDVRSAPLTLLSLALRNYNLNPDMEYYRAREVTISSTTPLAVQIDGDPIGATPMTFRVAPRALRALVPPWTSDDVIAPPFGLPVPLMDRIRNILIDKTSDK